MQDKICFYSIRIRYDTRQQFIALHMLISVYATFTLYALIDRFGGLNFLR